MVLLYCFRVPVAHRDDNNTLTGGNCGHKDNQSLLTTRVVHPEAQYQPQQVIDPTTNRVMVISKNFQCIPTHPVNTTTTIITPDTPITILDNRPNHYNHLQEQEQQSNFSGVEPSTDDFLNTLINAADTATPIDSDIRESIEIPSQHLTQNFINKFTNTSVVVPPPLVDHQQVLLPPQQQPQEKKEQAQSSTNIIQANNFINTSSTVNQERVTSVDVHHQIQTPVQLSISSIPPPPSSSLPAQSQITCEHQKINIIKMAIVSADMSMDESNSQPVPVSLHDGALLKSTAAVVTAPPLTNTTPTAAAVVNTNNNQSNMYNHNDHDNAADDNDDDDDEDNYVSDDNAPRINTVSASHAVAATSAATDDQQVSDDIKKNTTNKNKVQNQKTTAAADCTTKVHDSDPSNNNNNNKNKKKNNQNTSTNTNSSTISSPDCEAPPTPNVVMVPNDDDDADDVVDADDDTNNNINNSEDAAAINEVDVVLTGSETQQQQQGLIPAITAIVTTEPTHTNCVTTTTTHKKKKVNKKDHNSKSKQSTKKQPASDPKATDQSDVPTPAQPMKRSTTTKMTKKPERVNKIKVNRNIGNSTTPPVTGNKPTKNKLTDMTKTVSVTDDVVTSARSALQPQVLVKRLPIASKKISIKMPPLVVESEESDSGSDDNRTADNTPTKSKSSKTTTTKTISSNDDDTTSKTQTSQNSDDDNDDDDDEEEVNTNDKHPTQTSNTEINNNDDDDEDDDDHNNDDTSQHSIIHRSPKKIVKKNVFIDDDDDDDDDDHDDDEENEDEDNNDNDQNSNQKTATANDGDDNNNDDDDDDEDNNVNANDDNSNDSTSTNSSSSSSSSSESRATSTNNSDAEDNEDNIDFDNKTPTKQNNTKLQMHKKTKTIVSQDDDTSKTYYDDHNNNNDDDDEEENDDDHNNNDDGGAATNSAVDRQKIQPTSSPSPAQKLQVKLKRKTVVRRKKRPISKPLVARDDSDSEHEVDVEESSCPPMSSSVPSIRATRATGKKYLFDVQPVIQSSKQLSKMATFTPHTLSTPQHTEPADSTDDSDNEPYQPPAELSPPYKSKYSIVPKLNATKDDNHNTKATISHAEPVSSSVTGTEPLLKKPNVDPTMAVCKMINSQVHRQLTSMIGGTECDYDFDDVDHDHVANYIKREFQLVPKEARSNLFQKSYAERYKILGRDIVAYVVSTDQPETNTKLVPLPTKLVFPLSQHTLKLSKFKVPSIDFDALKSVRIDKRTIFSGYDVTFVELQSISDVVVNITVPPKSDKSQKADKKEQLPIRSFIYPDNFNLVSLTDIIIKSKIKYPVHFYKSALGMCLLQLSEDYFRQQVYFAKRLNNPHASPLEYTLVLGAIPASYQSFIKCVLKLKIAQIPDDAPADTVIYFAEGELELMAFLYWTMESTDLNKENMKPELHQRRLLTYLMSRLKCKKKYEIVYNHLVNTIQMSNNQVTPYCLLQIKYNFNNILHMVTNANGVERQEQDRLAWQIFMDRCHIHHYQCYATISSIRSQLAPTTNALITKLNQLTYNLTNNMLRLNGKYLHCILSECVPHLDYQMPKFRVTRELTMAMSGTILSVCRSFAKFLTEKKNDQPKRLIISDEQVAQFFAQIPLSVHVDRHQPLHYHKYLMHVMRRVIGNELKTYLTTDYIIEKKAEFDMVRYVHAMLLKMFEQLIAVDLWDQCQLLHFNRLPNNSTVSKVILNCVRDYFERPEFTNILNINLWDTPDLDSDYEAHSSDEDVANPSEQHGYRVPSQRRPTTDEGVYCSSALRFNVDNNDKDNDDDDSEDPDYVDNDGDDVTVNDEDIDYTDYNSDFDNKDLHTTVDGQQLRFEIPQQFINTLVTDTQHEYLSLVHVYQKSGYTHINTKYQAQKEYIRELTDLLVDNKNYNYDNAYTNTYKTDYVGHYSINLNVDPNARLPDLLMESFNTMVSGARESNRVYLEKRAELIAKYNTQRLEYAQKLQAEQKDKCKTSLRNISKITNQLQVNNNQRSTSTGKDIKNCRQLYDTTVAVKRSTKRTLSSTDQAQPSKKKNKSDDDIHEQRSTSKIATTDNEDEAATMADIDEAYDDDPVADVASKKTSKRKRTSTPKKTIKKPKMTPLVIIPKMPIHTVAAEDAQADREAYIKVCCPKRITKYPSVEPTQQQLSDALTGTPDNYYQLQALVHKATKTTKKNKSQSGDEDTTLNGAHGDLDDIDPLQDQPTDDQTKEDDDVATRRRRRCTACEQCVTSFGLLIDQKDLFFCCRPCAAIIMYDYIHDKRFDHQQIRLLMCANMKPPVVFSSEFYIDTPQFVQAGVIYNVNEKAVFGKKIKQARLHNLTTDHVRKYQALYPENSSVLLSS
jgi:hypothetical protein